MPIVVVFTLRPATTICTALRSCGAVAVGDGAKVSVMASINALGTNMAIVTPQPEARGGRRTNERGRLTERDAAAVVRLVPGVTATAPQLRNAVQIVVAGRNVNTTTIGITPDYARVANVGVETGRFISAVDVASGARVVLLGPSVAVRLFGDADAVGQMIRINRVPFTIVGVLETKGSSFGNDNDDVTLVPPTTARQRFTQTATQGPDDLAVLFVGFDDGVDLAQAKRDIVRVLRDRNNVRGGDAEPFTVRTTEEFMRESATVTSVFQGVLVAIASISLLVGGIGIMNIMLVSVAERTREIGLRMALGARRQDIRNQFLVEAAVLCIIGGAAGLILAVAAAQIFERAADFPAPIGLGTAIGAIAFSAAIGLGFGAYPAIRASRLSPIEALRSE
jgi:putative ABC transport system permease protein